MGTEKAKAALPSDSSLEPEASLKRTTLDGFMMRKVEKKRWFAVRCCCSPGTLYGFLLLDVTGRNEQLVIDIDGAWHNVTVKTLNGNAFATRTEEEAVYSDDRPLEFWRNIVGFVEIVDAHKEKFSNEGFGGGRLSPGTLALIAGKPVT